MYCLVSDLLAGLVMTNGSIICNTNLLSSEFIWEVKGEQFTLKA